MFKRLTFHTGLSQEIYRYFYDLSKLTYGGMFLVGILQKQHTYAMMALVLSTVLFIFAKYLENACLSG